MIRIADANIVRDERDDRLIRRTASLLGLTLADAEAEKRNRP
jgi:uncharacterized tellurite resistance protein B-like protein